MDFTQLLERVGNIKLKGGVFGKMTLAIMFVSGVLGTIAITSGNLYLQAATVILIAGFAAYFMNRLMTFTENNPHAAIMDGAEFLMRERILHETKSGGLLQSDTNTLHHEQPVIDSRAIEEPEANVAPQIEGGGSE